MSSLVVLAIAYGIVWALLFAYVLSLIYRERELHREVRVITQVLEEREAAVAPPPATQEPRWAEAPAIEATEASPAT